jgi:hypothetical protein
MRRGKPVRFARITQPSVAGSITTSKGAKPRCGLSRCANTKISVMNHKSATMSKRRDKKDMAILNQTIYESYLPDAWQIDQAQLLFNDIISEEDRSGDEIHCGWS